MASVLHYFFYETLNAQFFSIFLSCFQLVRHQTFDSSVLITSFHSISQYFKMEKVREKMNYKCKFSFN